MMADRGEQQQTHLLCERTGGRTGNTGAQVQTQVGMAGIQHTSKGGTRRHEHVEMGGKGGRGSGVVNR